MTVSVPFEISVDRILGGRLAIAQPRDGYRAAIDPVLLAACVPARAGERVLDLGCGVGTAALCLAWRVAGSRVTGIDLQDDLIVLAQRNARDNNLADRVEFQRGDVLAQSAGNFDHVLANPPYLERARASISPNPIKAQANVEGAAVLSDWVRAAVAMVSDGGSVTFIHRADRADELCALMGVGLGRLTQLPLLPKVGAAPKRVLVQGVMGAPHSLETLPPLVLHEAGGAFTGAVDAVLRDGVALPMLVDGALTASR
ncbi:MAG: methyltransferase [Rhodospirillaceae bacterium]|nr:methyltransferase [Rhodospirillaceae bacterium]